MIAYADNYFAGSLLTLLLPILLLIAIATWYVLSVRHVSEETPPTSAALPMPEVLAAAAPDDSAAASAPTAATGATPPAPSAAPPSAPAEDRPTPTPPDDQS